MIYLVRHGQTDWNLNKRVQGNTDIPLNKNGQLQAKNAAETISKLNINRIISSNLSRAKQTAKIINEKVGVNIEIDERIREVDYGEYEGINVEKFTEEMWDEFNKNPEKVNGESRINVFKRIKGFLDEIENKDEEGNTLIVTHGGALRMMMYCANNKDEFNMDKYMDYTKDMKISNLEILELKKKN